jgi:subtilisin family serine protease
MLICIFLSLSYIRVAGQDYLYVLVTNDALKPISKNTDEGLKYISNEENILTGTEALNKIFQKFGVSRYYQSFPNAKNDILSNFYEIHLKIDEKSERQKLIDHLYKELKESYIFPEIYLSDYYELDCNNPVGINDTWIAQNWVNNNALNMLDAKCAWTITTGSPDIVVAIIDTEFEPTHEDLKDRFIGTVGSRTHPQNHGTWVSSCVATTTNNNVGIAGIGYNTKLIGYYTSGGDLWNRIWTAYQDGYRIINVSWSGIGAYPTILAVQEMTENGTVLTLGAGNREDQTKSHELYADIPGVINVSGVDANNTHAGTGGHVHNEWVDICALSINVTACDVGNNYIGTWGTSFAAPQVAGVAALIRSLNSCFSPEDIENIIKATAEPIADASQYPGIIGAGRINAYKALQLAQQYLQPTNITTSTVWNNSRGVYADLIIESGTTLTIRNATIKFMPNTKIIVKPGGKLALYGCTLTNACGGLWQGIEVWGKPFTGDQSTYYQGALDMNYGATIENAVCAIYAGCSSISGQQAGYGGGGIIGVENSRFRNNKRDAEFTKYISRNNNGTEKANISSFIDCDFVVDDYALFPADRENKMVYVVGVNGIGFNGCNFVDRRRKTNIQEYGVAIVANSASIVTTGTSFYNTIGGARIPYKLCYFSGFFIAIQIQDAGTKDSRITWAKFDNNLLAIYGSAVNQLQIISCEINTAFDLPSYGSMGIQLVSCDGYKIENNVLSGDNGVGMFINNSGEGNNEIKYNTFRNLCIGAASYDINGQNSNNIGATGLQFRCNSFINSKNDDIYLVNNSIIRLFQGSPSVSTGNAFDNSSYQKRDINNTSPNLFSYHYDYIVSTHCPYNPTGPVYIIPAGAHGCDGTGAMGTSYYERPMPVRTIERLEEAYSGTYAMLREKKSWYDENYGERLIEWGEVFARGETMLEIPQVKLYVEITDLLSEIRLICREAIAVLKSAEVFDRETYHLWLFRENVISSDYLVVQSYVEVSNWEQVRNVLQEIPNRFPKEYNYDEHNDFITCLRYEERWDNMHPLVVPPEEIAILESYLNSFTGIALQKLTALLERVTGKNYLHLRGFQCDCNNTETENAMESSSTDSHKSINSSNENEQSLNDADSYSLAVYPNPSNGALHLNLENTTTVNIQQVDVYDIYGRELRKVENIGVHRTTVDLSGLSNGIYFIRVSMDNGENKIRRIVKE